MKWGCGRKIKTVIKVECILYYAYVNPDDKLKNGQVGCKENYHRVGRLYK